MATSVASPASTDGSAAAGADAGVVDPDAGSFSATGATSAASAVPASSSSPASASARSNAVARDADGGNHELPGVLGHDDASVRGVSAAIPACVATGGGNPGGSLGKETAGGAGGFFLPFFPISCPAPGGVAGCGARGNKKVPKTSGRTSFVSQKVVTVCLFAEGHLVSSS